MKRATVEIYSRLDVKEQDDSRMRLYGEAFIRKVKVKEFIKRDTLILKHMLIGKPEDVREIVLSLGKEGIIKKFKVPDTRSKYYLVLDTPN